MSTPVERWRLVLGRYAAPRLPAGGAERTGGAAGGAEDGGGAEGAELRRREAALDYLYGREYAGRGMRPEAGSLDGSQPHLVTWLGEVRELFPRQTVEVIEQHALQRYELIGLVSDPEVLQRLQPSEHLLRTLLTLRHHLSGEVLAVARRIIAQVVDELIRRLKHEVRRTLTGRRNQLRHSPLPIAANFDIRDTVRRNLRHWDPERKQLVLRELRFFERNSRRLPWDVIICVDQSGSMVDSVIHSAVMAGILAGLPSYRVRLVVFDTNVVDLTDRADDPVEVLLSVQLGGGTDIAQAVRYCSQLVEHPERTVLVLVTDFYEGGSPQDLVREVTALAESRVRLVGLAALDGEAHPHYDQRIAGRLADAGMHIAALTPAKLAEWLTEVTS